MVSHLIRSVHALCLLATIQSKSAFSESSDAIRKLYAAELSSKVLGASDIFMVAPGGQGWLGVVLAPPGTSIAALSEAFDGYSGGLVRSWTNSTAFDQPIDVREGYAFFAPRLMSAIWDDFLARARPSMDELQLQDLEARASKYLFKIQAKKRGKVVFSQAPSHYMIQYRMFEELYTILLNGKANDLWRLEPKLGLKFFEAPASTGYDSRLGTLVHEITHLWITGNTNRTSAEVYPKAECLILARTNPVGAQNNAQNYEYFVEDWLMR